MKRFSISYNVGKCKYVVNFADGIKKHNDGSPFFDIAIFSNKKKLAEFINNLQRNGYRPTTTAL